MNRPVSAIAAGAVGTMVMSGALAIFEIQTRYAIGIFAAIARFVRVPDNLFAGFVVYALVGTVAWPLLFVSLKPYVPLDLDPAVAGMLFALPLWIAFAIVGRGDVTGAIVVLFVAFTLIAHLVYGFVLGAVYASLADEHA
ncbi:hypothetical protein C475_16124 [Halosimplex carlsbadense 2-9-1]|uniref:Uncharacterized protein n=1 Tax=Halosimplex carlsbadense 2-9-1 TaxID=797114 RepID=M0CLE5_9EURY|nr:DUF6789 family protein [Halosimplex carlsbadense]ELZ23192.1 hypothetical protein C475_16124 [Halosimplex carlsbadense 2-9-1]